MRTDSELLAAKRKESMKVQCLECGKKWSTRKVYVDECPKCGGADIDIA